MAERVTLGRSRLALLLIATAAVAMAIGMVAALFVKSPQQLAAESAPPTRTVVQVPLEHKKITQSVVVNGTVLPENSTVVRLSIASGSGQEVIGDLPIAKGTRVDVGTRIATINGRPVVVLPGRVPAYRSLTPGISGDDVAQLQHGLRAAGHRIDDPIGAYGPTTRNAVAALYAKAGFASIEVGGEATTSAQSAVDQMSRQRDDARLALSRLQRDQRLAANHSVPSGTPGGRLALGSNPRDTDAVVDAQRSLERIQSDYQLALRRLSETRDKQGATVPMGEIVFVPELPAVVSELRSAVGQPASASQLTLVSGPLAVRAQLSADQASQVRADLPATVISSDASQFAAVTGPVLSVADSSGSVQARDSQTGTGSSTSYQVVLRPEVPIPPQAENQPSRVSIAVESTSSEVLAAPAAAVSTAADGSAQVILAGNPSRAVGVGVGFVGDGYVEVTPRSGEPLKAGDSLLIGAP